MRTTLLGSLLDAARGNLARGAERRRPLRVRPRLPAGRRGRRADGARPVDPLAGEFAGERPAPFREPHRLGALAVGPLAPRSWRGGGEPADFFALKGVLEALAAQLGVALAFEPAPSRSCIPAAPPRSRSPATPAGWIGEVHPLVCRELGPRGRGRLRSRPRGAARRGRAPARRSTRTSPPSRPSTRTSPSSCPAEVTAAAGPRGGPRGRRRAAALGRGLRPLRGRAARRGPQEPGPAARVPRRRPHPHRRGGRRPARGDRGRAGGDRRERCVA